MIWISFKEILLESCEGGDDIMSTMGAVSGESRDGAYRAGIEKGERLVNLKLGYASALVCRKSRCGCARASYRREVARLLEALEDGAESALCRAQERTVDGYVAKMGIGVVSEHTSAGDLVCALRGGTLRKEERVGERLHDEARLGESVQHEQRLEGNQDGVKRNRILLSTVSSGTDEGGGTNLSARSTVPRGGAYRGIGDLALERVKWLYWRNNCARNVCMIVHAGG
ncbi:hypothetical protein PC129_g19396 [Phytophthora cactorum]|uniref:Uncharacterized protein n=1 Tax=Phytophthora cactorum TaxID=29920 RepID=A0A329RH59_9STRA|nr:hypothetical protein Pcac1_g17285 [Phytophthora cactorum]KAG2800844.1 hypothetical protein PC111_g19802 [Phytophthora cactorum]KAG2800868.1 hypothetical protein PC112_g20287 [Phytophthora cactorum]KAG2839457.1 hypothetical protein PC113_g19457 [Phytophthora cactorum]KAG2879700.1 hypothetical protein PC114_g22432 [Phytophthora cactorum]